jgi:pyruvate-ferredoxin/flavodoxin oxidoreductase
MEAGIQMSNQAPSNGVRYPGIPTTADGAGTVVWVETHITEAGCAYPITSSTTMGTGYNSAVANGQRNLWGTKLGFLELESEHSSASTCEGFAISGGRVTNFTSGQGLMLMKEVLYTIAGKRLPVVFHIGARAMTSHSLNVHCGHDDVMGVVDAGWGAIFARNAQESGDFALISRRVAEDTETPFLNVQDGFLTTHTVESVRLREPEFMKAFIGDPRAKLRNLMDPKFPVMTGVVQNQDSYMKGKIAQRHFTDRIPDALAQAFREFREATGVAYDVVEGYRLDDAEIAFVGMGSMMETAAATVDLLREEGIRAGALSVIVFQPFPGPRVVEALRHLKAFAVVERMDNPLAQSNPLTINIKGAFADAVLGAPGHPRVDRMPVIHSGSAGMGSRDVRPGDFIALAKHMTDGRPTRFFCLGIDHPLALPRPRDPNVQPTGAFSMRTHSIGGYGSVTTNKVIASIGGDLFGSHVRAYPKYGSEKKGLPTTAYLTIAPSHIRMQCELEEVEMVAVLDSNAFRHSNPLSGLHEGGTCFLQSDRTTAADVWDSLPDRAREEIRKRRIRLLALDAVRIARAAASSPDLQQRMQGIVLLGVFLRTTPFVKRQKLTDEQLFAGVEKALRKYFGRRGDQVVRDNLNAVRAGYTEAIEVPREVMENAVEARSVAV